MMAMGWWGWVEIRALPAEAHVPSWSQPQLHPFNKWARTLKPHPTYIHARIHLVFLQLLFPLHMFCTFFED